MGEVVCDISISADGYVAGPNQTRENPFGNVPGERLHSWMFDTPDENAAEVSEILNAGAFVMGRSREPVTMQGGITFTFVTDGIESALAQARAVAGERNVAICGGASTVNQYLRGGYIDELRVHVAPVVFGASERLFDGVPTQNLELISARGASLVTHTTYRFVRA